MAKNHGLKICHLDPNTFIVILLSIPINGSTLALTFQSADRWKGRQLLSLVGRHFLFAALLADNRPASMDAQSPEFNFVWRFSATTQQKIKRSRHIDNLCITAARTTNHCTM
eukprot:evm.model.scf_323EXC.2 EVM.evm.TU.scf_323EXC.2   scf_323EXC:11650-11985(-)